GMIFQQVFYKNIHLQKCTSPKVKPSWYKLWIQKLLYIFDIHAKVGFVDCSNVIEAYLLYNFIAFLLYNVGGKDNHYLAGSEEAYENNNILKEEGKKMILPISNIFMFKIKMIKACSNKDFNFITSI
ncbi:hypothetical protein ACJX0J_013078, partial [Zea mays]